MYQALRAHFENVNDNLKDMKQRCQNRHYKDDPVMAMQCVVGALATGGTGNVQVKITRFEKIACAPPGREAGYRCDYIMGMEMPGAMTTPSMQRMIGNGTRAQARFLQSSRGWMYLPDPN